jgi:hypothetical protein
VSEYIIARIDLADAHRERFYAWLLEEHLPSAREVAGLAPDPSCYRSELVETVVRTYRPQPEVTIVYPLEPDVSVHELAADDVFLSWWLDAITTRFTWVTSHGWVGCRRLFGPPGPVRGERALVTQVEVAESHAASWAAWYRERHVPDARAVPGLFGDEMWQFESFDVHTAGWHVSPKPRFTHLLPIRDGADWVAGAGTPEFLRQVADTQSMWAGAIEHVVSNLCTRIAGT